MPKILAVIGAVLVLMVGYPVSATLQIPDDIIIDDRLCELDADRVATPLESYFYKTGAMYPFQLIAHTSSTANYRGHIATWRVEEDRLFLDKIRVERYEWDKRPMTLVQIDVPLKKIFGPWSKDTAVAADWFTGVLHILCPPVEWSQDGDYIVAKVTGGIIEERVRTSWRDVYFLLMRDPHELNDVDESMVRIITAHKEYEANIDRWSNRQIAAIITLLSLFGVILISGIVIIIGALWNRKRSPGHRIVKRKRLGLGLIVLGLLGIVIVSIYGGLIFVWAWELWKAIIL